MNQLDAERIIRATEEVFGKVSGLLDIVNATCDGVMRDNFQHAIGVAIAELDLEIIGCLQDQFPNVAQRNSDND